MEPVAIDEFYKKYRDQMKRAYDMNRNLLDEQRLQQQQSIMGQANKQGMLYSNFPARTKIQYDVQKYNPAVSNLYNAYQTGLDSLRNKGVQLANQIKQYQEGIDDFNYYTSVIGNNGNTTTVSGIIDQINQAS